jgi:hypothetical protein
MFPDWVRRGDQPQPPETPCEAVFGGRPVPGVPVPAFSALLPAAVSPAAPGVSDRARLTARVVVYVVTIGYVSGMLWAGFALSFVLTVLVCATVTSTAVVAGTLPRLPYRVQKI